MALLLGSVIFQAFDDSGNPLSGGKVHTYEPGTTTNKATYPTIADANAGTNANANPVILDSRGEANIVLAGETKIVLKDSDDVTIYTVDNVAAGARDITDDNGNELLTFTTTASAVNHVDITNAATTGAPLIAADGTDTNISLSLSGKGTGVVNILGTSTASSEIRLFEDTDNGSNYFGVKAPAALTASTTFTLPDGDGSSGQVLQTNGSGTLSWASSADNVDESFTVNGTASAPGEIRLAEDTDNGTNYVGFAAPAAVTASAVLELPDGDGSSGQVLQTDGAGVLSWSSVLTANTPLTVEGSASSAAEIRLEEDTDNGSNYMAIKAPAAVTSNTTLTLPDGDGSNGQVLVTNGSGTLSWANNTTPTATGFRVTKTSTQSINSSTVTKVTWSSEQIDVNGDFASDRHTPTVAGVYQYNAQVAYANCRNSARTYLYKNGSAVAYSDLAASSTNSQPMTPTVSTVIQMNGTTDYVEVYTYHTDGTAESISGTAGECSFSGVLCSPS